MAEYAEVGVCQAPRLAQLIVLFLQSPMHQKKKAVLFALIGTVVVLNLFVAGLFGYALNASKMRKEQEVRTTVENLALLLDQSVTGHIREINLSLTQIQAELEQDLREGRFGHKPERVAMLSSHENWLSQVAEIRVTDARGRCCSAMASRRPSM